MINRGPFLERQMKYKYLTGLIFFAAITASYSLFTADNKACAAEVAPQPCDAQYWDSMTHRAWMEAEREIVMNQNLIFKPDSVLEYVCFDKFLDHNAGHAGPIFIHTEYFGKKIFKETGPNSMEWALTEVVSKSLKPYQDENFNHVFLGGRAEFLDLDPKDYPLKDETTKGTYANCNMMAAVWETAKCLNFVDNDEFEDNDSFYPFETLVNPDGDDVVGYNNADFEDPREFPTQCGKPDNPPWQEAIDKAENKNDDQYDFAVPLEEAFTAIRERLEPGECGNPPILTGVTVRLSPGAGVDPYDDGVCTNPGCTFTQDGSCE